MLEVCVWAWYKRSQTLWHLRREEVWQCWSNSSGESGHSPSPPLHRQHCVCVCVCVLHYVYTSTWALSYTLHPFRFDQLCLHEPSQRSGYSISQHLLCAEACSGGPCARSGARSVRAGACVRQLATASFGAASAAAAADPSHLLWVTGIEENPGFGVWCARQ